MSAAKIGGVRVNEEDFRACVKKIDNRWILFLNLNPDSDFAFCNHEQMTNHGECVNIEVDRVMEELGIDIDCKTNLEYYSDD